MQFVHLIYVLLYNCIFFSKQFLSRHILCYSSFLYDQNERPNDQLHNYNLQKKIITQKIQKPKIDQNNTKKIYVKAIINKIKSLKFEEKKIPTYIYIYIYRYR